MITQSIDDGLVHILKLHNKNPILMWAALAADFNTITPAQLSLAKSVRMLDVIEIGKQNTKHWMGNGSTRCSELHELLGTAIRSFLMSYIKELKVRTRQH